MPKATPPIIVKWKKKKVHGGGHHGGAWKVAYADFITVLFALFLVLWLMSQADLKLRQELARYFRSAGIQSGGSMLGDKIEIAKTNQARPLDAALAIVQGSGEEIQALRAQGSEIQRALEREAEFSAVKDHIRVEVREEGLEIQVLDSGTEERKGLLFDLSSAGLKPDLVALLKELAVHLGTLPNHIEIGGHTDARPFSLAAGHSNWDLSFARANNARAVLEAFGLRPNQISQIRAYGSEKPLNAADPLADENRRLTILARRERGEGSAGGHGESIVPRLAMPGAPPE